MDTTTQILIRILGNTDAIFWPNRDATNHQRGAVIAEARELYRTAGVIVPAIAGAGASEAERMAATRAARDLANRGMIRTAKPRWTKATAYRLTDPGDTFARAMAGLPTLHEARALLERLARLASHPLAIDVQGFAWTCELHLANVPWPNDGRGGQLTDEAKAALVEQIDALLPAMVRGLVLSRATTQRLVCFALTPEGRAWLASAPTPARALPKPRPAAAHLYDRELSAAKARLATARPRHEGEIGDIPLPVTAPTPRPGAQEALQVYLQTGVIE